MLEIILEKLLPIFLFFTIGYILKMMDILKKEEASVLLKLVFYLLSPAVIILSVSGMKLERELLLYPISALCIHAIMIPTGLFLSKLIKLNDDERKVFRGATLIMNMTFILPFFIVFFGEKNLYLLSLFDAGNLVIVTTVVYSIFVSSKEDTAMDKVKKLLKSPLIIALIIGFVLNITGLKLPKGIEITMQEIAEMTGTLIMIALGAYFTPKFKKLKLSLIIVAIKVIGILIATFIIGKFLPIDEMGRKIMLLGAFSPVGNNILTFVFVTDGDMELAINVVSLSIILSFINVSLLLVLS
ncbi:MAG: AEC family transporter [Fusobacterium sp.]|jgi:predicted permease|uniref:AEC family transporter n=1 Tax=Fusobacterium sp. TaxID=68766 RepID=UPI002A7654B5|nr:AEC family transporter [Fusobacterium sp.]MDY3059724.1 AEC family transporter [Fusobacterium sp.]MEE1475462.1 AEC family transporter [Fusobacterium sp.]